jgi:hypothetical protein
MARVIVAGMLLGLTTLAGCGSGSSGPIANPQKEALADLGQMLKQLSTEGKRPPGKLAELAPVEPLVPLAGVALRGGQIVYFWGAEYTAGGTRIVAHVKRAPDAGGWVLLEDGTVKEFSASEFAAAPKAKK